MQKLSIFFIIAFAAILAACTPPPSDDGLPTLIRFPSETPADVRLITDPSEIAAMRTPLPATFTPTYTFTPSPTLDPSVTASLTPTITVTPSSTITDTPSPTATFPPPLPPEERPILAFALTARAATVLPPDYVVPPHVGADVTLIPTQNLTPNGTQGVIVISGQATQAAQNSQTGACSSSPSGGFLTVYQSNPDIAALLGCTNGNLQANIPAAWQSFEQGSMIWLNGQILALYNVTDVYETYPDTFVQGVDPETSSETPPSGLLAPVRGFLKAWSNNPNVRNNLGWATLGEQGATGTAQAFANGRMLYLSGRNEILVFIGTNTGRWLAFQAQY